MKDIEPIRGSIGWYEQMAPPDMEALKDRLIWKSYNGSRPGLDKEAIGRTQQSTDFIRGQLIPSWHISPPNTLTQISQLHTAHLEGNEHYLLDQYQASVAAYEVLATTDQIAGVSRSPYVLPQNVEFAGSLPAVSYQNVHVFMEGLAAKADLLFPPGGMNPAVDVNSIYQYLSGIQFAMILVHPFFEANARVSEDALYVFWSRRPDLADTVRYISDDGTRISAKVSERTDIIHKACNAILRRMAIELGLPEEGLKDLKYFAGLIKQFESPEGTEGKKARCRAWIEGFVGELIDHLDDPKYLTNFPGILALSENLVSSSSSYAFKHDK